MVLVPDGLQARMAGVEYQLRKRAGGWVFATPGVELTLDGEHGVVASRWVGGDVEGPCRVDMWIYHAMVHILRGLSATGYVSPVSAVRSCP